MTNALIDPAGKALTDPAGNMLIFALTLPPQPPVPPPDFASCVRLAEMHRQANYLIAQMSFTGNYQALQRAFLVADHQYFLEVLSCAVEFNTTAPSAVDGLQDTTNRLMKPPS